MCSKHALKIFEQEKTPSKKWALWNQFFGGKILWKKYAPLMRHAHTGGGGDTLPRKREGARPFLSLHAEVRPTTTGASESEPVQSIYYDTIIILSYHSYRYRYRTIAKSQKSLFSWKNFSVVFIRSLTFPLEILNVSGEISHLVFHKVQHNHIFHAPYSFAVKTFLLFMNFFINSITYLDRVSYL